RVDRSRAVVMSTSREENGVPFRNRGGRATAAKVAAYRGRQPDRPPDDARGRRLGLSPGLPADLPAPPRAGVLVAALRAAALCRPRRARLRRVARAGAGRGP